MLGQRAEHQHAVDGVVGVEPVDGGKHILLGGVGGQDEFLHVDANKLCTLGGTALIGQVAGIFADAQDAQGGGDAPLLQGGGAFGQLCVEGVGDFLAQ